MLRDYRYLRVKTMRIREFALAGGLARRAWPAGTGGQALIEFAIIAPIFLALLCAIFEFSGIMFVQTLLEGAAREASRYGITGQDGGEISREDRIVQIVTDNSYGIVDVAELQMETLVYARFEDIGRPEPFTDQNGNGLYDAGEPYTDINGNGQWDADMGAAGLGGPGDIVVYRLRYDWPVMIPLFVPWLGQSVALRANIVVRNEPFPGT